MEGIEMWECRFCERRIPKELYIFHDTFCKKHQTGLETTIKHQQHENQICVEKETNSVNKNTQNREDTYITLDIEMNPIWLEFEKEIQKIRNETRK